MVPAANGITSWQHGFQAVMCKIFFIHLVVEQTYICGFTNDDWCGQLVIDRRNCTGAVIVCLGLKGWRQNLKTYQCPPRLSSTAKNQRLVGTTLNDWNEMVVTTNMHINSSLFPFFDTSFFALEGDNMNNMSHSYDHKLPHVIFGVGGKRQVLTQQGSLALPQKHSKTLYSWQGSFFQMCYEMFVFCTNRRFQPWNALDTL